MASSFLEAPDPSRNSSLPNCDNPELPNHPQQLSVSSTSTHQVPEDSFMPALAAAMILVLSVNGGRAQTQLRLCGEGCAKVEEETHSAAPQRGSLPGGCEPSYCCVRPIPWVESRTASLTRRCFLSGLVPFLALHSIGLEVALL